MMPPPILVPETLAMALIYLVAALALGCSDPAAWPWYFGGHREPWRPGHDR